MAEEAESPTQIDNDELFEKGLILAHELFSEQLINDQERDHLKGKRINTSPSIIWGASCRPGSLLPPAIPALSLWTQTRPKFTKAAVPLGPCPPSEWRGVHRLPQQQQHC